MKKKHLLVTVVVIIIAIVGIVALMGSFNFSTASLSDTAVAEQVDNDYRPVEVVEEFSTTTEVIYATCEVSNVPSDTEIKTEWYYLNENEQFTTISDDVEGGSGSLSFSYEPDQGWWPAGDYEVRFFLNDEHVDTTTFSVEAEEEANISDVAMAEELDDEGRPVKVVNEFNPDTEVFYATCEISNALPDTEIETELYYVDNDQKVISEPIPINDFYTGPGRVRYTKPYEGWPTGDYEVRFFLDGELVETATFSVTESLISLDPASDLLTAEDVPNDFVEDTEAGWEEEQSEFDGVPFESAAFRLWEHPTEDKLTTFMDFVCSSIEDAQDVLYRSHAHWSNDFDSYDDTTVENTDFRSYGDEIVASKAIDIEDGSTYTRIATLRVKNVSVTVVTANLSPSEIRDYCELLESRILEKSGE